MDQFIQHFVPSLISYEWLVEVGLIFFGMLLFHWFSRKTYHFLLRRFDSNKHVWMVSFIKSVHVPWLTFFWVFVVSYIVPIVMLRFHIDITHLPVVDKIRSLLFLGTIYWSLLEFIKRMEEEIAPRWAFGPVRDKTTVRALAQLSRVVVTILLVLSILPILGFQTSSLLAFGGVSGLAVTFAAKDTLSNFLGGMMIFVGRPFSVGDWIRSPDRNIEGTVEHIGWRLTRIRTFSKRPLYVPNSVFSSVSIENPSRMTNRRIDTTIGVRYRDATKIAVIVKEIDEMVQAHPGIDGTQSIMVHFVQFDSSSLNLNLYAFTKTTDWAKYRDIQQEVFLKSIAIITAHGAECAFPTTTLSVPEPIDLHFAGETNHVGESDPNANPGSA